jgi:hypothetical protein
MSDGTGAEVAFSFIRPARRSPGGACAKASNCAAFHVLTVGDACTVARPGKLFASLGTPRLPAWPVTALGPERPRELAASLGMTERSAHGIVSDLAEPSYVVKLKDGRRNR